MLEHEEKLGDPVAIKKALIFLTACLGLEECELDWKTAVAVGYFDLLARVLSRSEDLFEIAKCEAWGALCLLLNQASKQHPFEHTEAMLISICSASAVNWVCQPSAFSYVDVVKQGRTPSFPSDVLNDKGLAEQALRSLAHIKSVEAELLKIPELTASASVLLKCCQNREVLLTSVPPRVDAVLDTLPQSYGFLAEEFGVASKVAVQEYKRPCNRWPCQLGSENGWSEWPELLIDFEQQRTAKTCGFRHGSDPDGHSYWTKYCPHQAVENLCQLMGRLLGGLLYTMREEHSSIKGRSPRRKLCSPWPAKARLRWLLGSLGTGNERGRAFRRPSCFGSPHSTSSRSRSGPKWLCSSNCGRAVTR